MDKRNSASGFISGIAEIDKRLAVEEVYSKMPYFVKDYQWSNGVPEFVINISRYMLEKEIIERKALPEEIFAHEAKINKWAEQVENKIAASASQDAKEALRTAYMDCLKRAYTFTANEEIFTASYDKICSINSSLADYDYAYTSEEFAYERDNTVFEYPLFVKVYDCAGESAKEALVSDVKNQAGVLKDVKNWQNTVVKTWMQDSERKILDCRTKGLEYIFKKRYNRALEQAENGYIFTAINGDSQTWFSCRYEDVFKIAVCPEDGFRYVNTRKTILRTSSNAPNKRTRIPETRREAVMRRDNFRCQICGRYMPDKFGLEIDHIVPVAKGGTNDIDNLQVLCTKCNKEKSDKLALVYREINAV